MSIQKIIDLAGKPPETLVYSEIFLKKYIRSFEQKFSEILFVRQEAGVLHNSFEWVRAVYESVKENNREKILDLLNQNGDIRYGVLSEDKLRSNKNLIISLIVGIALLGMNERIIDTELAFTALDTSILLVEDAEQLDEILPMTYASLFKFADLIENYRQKDYHYLVKRTKEYIYQNFHDRILISDIAEKLDVNEDYLSRLFRKTEGIALKEFIQRERITRCQNLLMYSDRSIQEIGNYMAFSSQSHFVSVFRKYAGMTPGQFRKKNL